MKTQDVIKNVAIDHFSKFGYKGTSLSSIAKDVGIKKPSLYAHFDSKLSLFETCMESAMEDFLDVIGSIVKNDKDGNAAAKGEDILYNLLEYFLHTEDTKITFYLVFSYMPLEELGEEKLRYSNEFIHKMLDIINEPVRDLAEARNLPSESVNEIKDAFLCMYDGLMVEYLFGDSKSYSRRLNASWAVFMRGVK